MDMLLKIGIHLLDLRLILFTKEITPYVWDDMLHEKLKKMNLTIQ